MFYNFFYFLLFHFSLIWYTNFTNFFSAWLDLDFEFDGFGSKIEDGAGEFENFRKNKKSSPKN